MKAKKSYGQHFLKSKATAKRIANSLSGTTTAYKKVLEIGPGKGMLTQFLMDRDYELFVVEADRDMVQYLERNFSTLKEKIIPADFLKLDLRSIFGEEQIAIIGNFPYNISSQILFKMLENKEQIPELVGMFQKEVAMRVIAGPGSKTYGVISVLVQAYYEGEYLFSLDGSEFIPPPKVMSGVIRLTRKNNQIIDYNEKLFKAIVKQTFGQRRKMLRNTMKSFIKDTSLLKDDFFKQRPEQLSVDDYIRLTKLVSQEK